MENQQYTLIESLDFFRDMEALCDIVYKEVASWPQLPMDTVGRQLVRALDSIGANIVEGDARQTPKESLRYFNIAQACCGRCCSGDQQGHEVQRAAGSNERLPTPRRVEIKFTEM